MGKKNRSSNGASMAPRGANQTVSLREETSGRRRVDGASLLRVKHLQRLAAWAGAEAWVGPLGALLGRRLAESAEAAGVPLGTATFLCQMCETVLKPGFNCMVRIKNKRNKTKPRKKSNYCQNSVAYACNFCGDQNLILGSGKGGAVKILLSSREKASLNSACRISRGNNSYTRQDMKGALEHSQAEMLLVDSSSRLRQSNSEMDEHDERLLHDLPIDCKTEEGVALSVVESVHLAPSAFEEDSIHKLVYGNTNDEHLHKTEPISSEVVQILEANVTSKAEFPVDSKFVTPQKTKLMRLNGPKDSAEPFKTSKANRKGESSGSVSHTLSSKLSPNDSRNYVKSAVSSSVQVSGSSRKRARKGWTTLKQIAEKDELERKEKMGNFVIPFFGSEGDVIVRPSM